MKRERLTQIVLAIVGLLNLVLIYFLYIDLRHSRQCSAAALGRLAKNLNCIAQIEILCVLRGPTQEADGALNGRYRVSRYFKPNTIATMAKTIGQKMLASGPTVPPVSQRGPLNDAFRRFWVGSQPLFGTPYKNV